MTELVEMKIVGLGCCPAAGRKTVILQDLSGKKFIPLLLDPREAEILSLELRERPSCRSATHRLLLSLLELVRGRIKYLIIHELRADRFYASLSLDLGGSEQILDCSAFDALVLALKGGASLYVSRWVLEATGRDIGKTAKRSSESENWKSWIAKLKPEDFGQ